MSTETPQFTLYSHRTCPAGFKVAHVLSLLHLSFKTIYIAISPTQRENLSPWFIALNPNGRAPILIDHAQNDTVVWESTAILQYLVALYDPTHTLWPRDIFAQTRVNQWLLLQASGQGPSIGQAFWFGYWHKQVHRDAYERYVKETQRILGVLEVWLGTRRWLVDETMSLADISFLSWYEEAFMVDVDIEKGFPMVQAWLERMKGLPEVVKASQDREMIKPAKLWER